MTRDYSVYARGDQVAIQDLIDEMRVRGTPIEWREDPFFPSREGGPWEAAYVAPEGAPLGAPPAVGGAPCG